MTSVRTYGIEKEKAIQEIQSGITEVEARMAAGINEIQEGEKELERRMDADIKQKQVDAGTFAVDFWEGD